MVALFGYNNTPNFLGKLGIFMTPYAINRVCVLQFHRYASIQKVKIKLHIIRNYYYCRYVCLKVFSAESVFGSTFL